MSRRGKIAGLPREIREELNERIDDGQQGKDLVEWLNNVDEVQETLACNFDGRPITEQNLSDWKQGAFCEWKSRQEVRDRLHSFSNLSEDLDKDGWKRGLPDRLAAAFAAKLVAETDRLLEDSTDPKERCRLISEALKQIHLTREAGHGSARARIEEARWEDEFEEREEKKKALARSKILDLMMEPFRTARRRAQLVEAYGGGEIGEKAADLIIDSEKKCSEPALFTEPLEDPPDPDALGNPGDPEELYLKHLYRRAAGIEPDRV